MKHAKHLGRNGKITNMCSYMVSKCSIFIFLFPFLIWIWVNSIAPRYGCDIFCPAIRFYTLLRVFKLDTTTSRSRKNTAQWSVRDIKTCPLVASLPLHPKSSMCLIWHSDHLNREKYYLGVFILVLVWCQCTTKRRELNCWRLSNQQ